MLSRTQSPGLSLPAIVLMSVFVVGSTAILVWLHQRTHAVVDPKQIALALFLAVNLMIAFWEIALFVRQDQIQEEYGSLREPYRGREIEAALEVFLRPIPIHRVFSLREWARIWSAYSLYDNGFADRRAYGFNIDVGNGFTTFVPTALFALGMTFHFLPPRVLGILGVIFFWQMFHGTTVYFFQFFNNGRHKGHSVRDILLVVGLSNVVWWIFPALGLYASTKLILDGSYAIFLQ